MSLSVTRAQDYAEWYQQVVKAADMAENSSVRGCMIMKPWGYGLWENIQRILDKRIKETGHENCYFPLLIPLSLFQKEADHIEGFAKEMAIVTHSKLTTENGTLKLAGELDEPLVIRPTSEAIIAESFANWIQSYRDLPVLINQWANVMRWEMRTRLFLRTSEFLWQEGHTAHATREEAEQETLTMLEVYRELSEDVLAMPTILGKKCESERFPGAVETYTFESMMQDGRALQAGTSHYLGQTFAKSANIRFQNEKGEQEYVHTTSWGISTRLIGGLIMTHGDDDGLKVPPRVAPYQVVIVPIVREREDEVLAYAERLATDLKAQQAFGEPVRVLFDKRLKSPQDKRWEWLRKGAPLVIEVGPKDVDSAGVAVTTRLRLHDKKGFVSAADFVAGVSARLTDIQVAMFDAAKMRLDANIRTDIKTFDELKAFFAQKNTFAGDDQPNPVGFAKVKWCGETGTEDVLKEFAATVRCLPLEQSGTEGVCVLTGKPATLDAIFARAY